MPKFAIGDVLPDLMVNDTEGQAVPLSKMIGSRGLFIFVLRGTWCPFCVTQIQSVRRNQSRYTELGVNSVFITPESRDSLWAFRMSMANPLPFGLYADPKHDTLAQLVREDAIATLPVTYLLDTNRRVVWNYIGKDSEDRPGHRTVMQAIEAHLAAPEAHA